MFNGRDSLDHLANNLRRVVFSNVTSASQDVADEIKFIAARLEAAHHLPARPHRRITAYRRQLNRQSQLASLPVRTLVQIARHLDTSDFHEENVTTFISYRRTCHALFTAMRGGVNIWDCVKCPAMSFEELEAFLDVDSQLVHITVVITPENVNEVLTILRRNLPQIEEMQLRFTPRMEPVPSTLIQDGRFSLIEPGIVTYAKNDFMVIGDGQDRVTVEPAPHLKFLIVDLGTDWSDNFSSAYNAHLPPRPRDQVGPWDWQIPRGLFVLGAILLESLVLRGTAWPDHDIQSLTFGRLTKFAFEGPAWLTEQDMNRLLVAAPVLRSLTLHIRTFERDDSPSADVNSTAASSLRRLYVTVSKSSGNPLLLSYFYSRGAPDILVSDQHQLFRDFKLPRGSLNVSATITGYSIVENSIDVPARRVRFLVGDSTRSLSHLLQCLRQQIDLKDLTSLSLHEFIFVELLDTTLPSSMMQSLRNAAALPSVERLVIWLASCGQHNEHGANRVSNWGSVDSTGMFVAISSTATKRYLFAEDKGPSTFFTLTLAQRAASLLPSLQTLVISVGPDRQSRTVLRRRTYEVCGGSSTYYDDEHPSKRTTRPCACDNPPTLALSDVQSFLEHIRFPNLRRLEIRGLHIVDVKPELYILQLQSMGVDLQFETDAVHCDMCPVPIGDMLDAQDVYDALDGW